MQPHEGSQPKQSFESPSKERPSHEELPSNHANNQNLEGFAGCSSDPNGSDYTSTFAASSNPQQPETLNLPAVLWDKPVGSKIRVPPPVPPRSPRKPMDPVSSGAFEEAMAASFNAESSQANVAPQRGLLLDVSLAQFIKIRFHFHILSYTLI